MLTLLSTSAASAGSGDVTSVGTMWQATTVPATLVPTETIGQGSELFCAYQASQRAWCSAYCFVDGVCSMYVEDIPAEKTTSACKTTSPACPAPFSLYPGLEDVGCLYEVLSGNSWNVSRDICQEAGGDLLVPSGPEQYARIIAYFKGYIPGGLWWVGIYDNVWLTGRVGVTAEWDAGQPNRGEEHCGAMLSSSTMGDYHCSTVFRAVCQIR
ncbi:uncharacterized protein LOC125039802 [Penaeus chinensis]|uniref:uncharacterized protein LOC125039802 n=1 Tax=Penaeus chinensis TaxID=139456 RepID=UPI001FB64B2F|nr:uncharacterized protein LOC125039802 [Penaeus chinensis]